MSDGQCSTPECERNAVARGLCARCYKRWQNSVGAGGRCSIEGCGRPAVSRGWCRTHYARWTRHGTTNDPITSTEAARFWAKTDKHGPEPEHQPRLGPCWLWTGARLPNGYGVFGSKVERYAQRWAYVEVIGAIPDHFEIDHLCRVRHCVRPDHLEAVTRKVNTLRSEAPSAKAARKTRCEAGHEFDLLNTYVDKRGRRHCRACQRARDAVRGRTDHRRAYARELARTKRARRGVKTHCPHGHEYTPENTYINPQGFRACRECVREAQRRRRAEQLANQQQT